MIISSLEQMEQIVASNKQLFWDGWDVVKKVPSATAWMSPNGSFYRGRWYLESRFPVTENGWKLPNKLVG